MDDIFIKSGNEDATLLIVDDDPLLCETLEKLISTWGMETEFVASASEALDRLKHTFFNIILLDVVMPEKSGIDLIPEIAELCHDSKIIIISGYADKEMAIEALRHGAFDFLEKPFDFPLLSHSINRALEMQKAERNSRKSVGDLKSSHDELLIYKSRLEDLNRQLMENNKALSVLAKSIEITQQQTAKSIVLKIRTLIIPIIERLQQDKTVRHYHRDLNILMGHLDDLSWDLTSDLNVADLLSSSELRIASLIKNGFTTDAIADHLCIASCTVKTHRRNIRKKLEINNQRCNLRDYLRSEGVGD